jgi:hypothetical protein
MFVEIALKSLTELPRLRPVLVSHVPRQINSIVRKPRYIVMGNMSSRHGLINWLAGGMGSDNGPFDLCLLRFCLFTSMVLVRGTREG